MTSHIGPKAGPEIDLKDVRDKYNISYKTWSRLFVGGHEELNQRTEQQITRAC